MLLLLHVKKTNTEICETDKNLTCQTLKVSSASYGNVKIQIFERGVLWSGSKQNCSLTKMPAKWDSTVCSVTVERWCSIAFMMRDYILALRCCPERKWLISLLFFFPSNVCPSVCRAAGRTRRELIRLFSKNLEPTSMSKPGAKVALNQCSRALQNFPSTTVPRRRDLY